MKFSHLTLSLLLVVCVATTAGAGGLCVKCQPSGCFEGYMTGYTNCASMSTGCTQWTKCGSGVGECGDTDSCVYDLGLLARPSAVLLADDSSGWQLTQVEIQSAPRVHQEWRLASANVIPTAR